MATIVRFVDAIVASPTTVLDLNSAPLMVKVEGIDISPPDVRRSKVETFIGADGDIVTDFAPENRIVKIPIVVVRTPTAELASDSIVSLHTQLSKPRNILMLQLDGMTKPVFFRTYAAPDYSIKMLRLLLAANTELELEIPAEPYGYGPKVTLSTRTIYNSPYGGALAAINGDFETNVNGWEIETGSSTFIRHTSVGHAGTCSLEVDPNGTSPTVRVRLNANVAASPGQQWRARGWIQNNNARTCNLDLGFFNGSSLIGSYTTQAISLPAATWRYFDISATAPATTTGVRIAASMGGTPNTNDFMKIDEMKLNQHHTEGSMYTDISGVLGDTDTPLFMEVTDNFATSLWYENSKGQPVTLLSMRKGGNPDNVPFMIESETFTAGTDTAIAVGDGGIDASNGRYLWCQFTTNNNLVRRMYTASWPTVFSNDLRGRYDVYLRARNNSGAGIYKVQLGWSTSRSAGEYGAGTLLPVYKGDLITMPTNLSSNNWYYMYVGTISFPSGFDPVTDGYSNQTLQAATMYVELAVSRSGGGTIDIDSFNFFPADDESCLIKWPARQVCTKYVIDGRNTSVYGLDGSGNVVAATPIALAGAVPMLRPGVTNRLFFARDVSYGATSTQSLGTGDNPHLTTTITPYYWPRYWNIRRATT